MESSNSKKEGDYLRKNDSVPVWEKALLTLDEAAQYFGIGLNKLREITDTENCPFVLFNGSKRLIKRRLFDAYLEQAYSI